jgi:O-antigen ligase
MISIAFFLWLALTYFWDYSGGFSIKDLEGYALFLFVPALLAVIPKIPPKKIAWTCLAFVISTTLVTVICLVKAYLDFRTSGDYRVFYYQYLSMQVGINAIYLSAYCVAAITWLLYFGYINNRLIKLKKIVVIPVCSYLCLVVFLLSSKMVIFILLLILVFFILYIGFVNKKLGIAVLLLVSITVAGIIVLNRLPYLRWRISVTKIKDYNGEKDDQNGVAVRMIIWKSALELIEERPLAGFGIRGAKEAMLEKYKAKHFDLGLTNKFNCHNQYLETTLRSGVIGLAILLSMLMIVLVNGIRQKNFLLIILLLHFMCTSVVESTLEVQRGLVFFFFFIFLFYYHSPGTNSVAAEKIRLQ